LRRSQRAIPVGIVPDRAFPAGLGRAMSGSFPTVPVVWPGRARWDRSQPCRSSGLGLPLVGIVPDRASRLAWARLPLIVFIVEAQGLALRVVVPSLALPDPSCRRRPGSPLFVSHRWDHKGSSWSCQSFGPRRVLWFSRAGRPALNPTDRVGSFRPRSPPHRV
jgi:hypothetical protein